MGGCPESASRINGWMMKLDLCFLNRLLQAFNGIRTSSWTVNLEALVPVVYWILFPAILTIFIQAQKWKLIERWNCIQDHFRNSEFFFEWARAVGTTAVYVGFSWIRCLIPSGITKWTSLIQKGKLELSPTELQPGRYVSMDTLTIGKFVSNAELVNKCQFSLTLFR